MLYEIGYPRAYIVPDVVCDFTGATYEQVGKDRARASGAEGRRPTTPTRSRPPATATTQHLLHAGRPLGGGQGRHSANAIVRKTQRMFREKKMGDYRDVSIEIIGGEPNYGPYARAEDSREVVVKIAAKHDQKEALSLVGGEIAPC